MRALLITLLLLLFVFTGSANQIHQVQLDSRLLIRSATRNSWLKAAIAPDSSWSLLSQVINSANYSIFIEIYEAWSSDLLNLLQQKASQGVAIKVLFEDRANKSDETHWWVNQLLSYGNVQVREASTSLLYFHGKLIIIDNKTVLVSSENLVDTAFPDNPFLVDLVEYQTPSRGWVVATNDQYAVQKFLEQFLDDWSNGTPYTPGTYSVPYSYGQTEYDAAFTDVLTTTNFDVQPVISPKSTIDSSLADAYSAIIDMINLANHTIYIEQLFIKYYQLDELIDALRVAHDKRGVTVMIIVEDDTTIDGNYQNCSSVLREYGFHVLPAFEGVSGDPTRSTFLHNKGIIVDDCLVFVGSINWGSGSFFYEREFGLIIKSGEMARYFKEAFAYDWNSSLVSSVPSSDYYPFDTDEDGLPDIYEIEHRLSRFNPDTDGDGLSDYEEVFITGTNPLVKDVDLSPPSVKITSPENDSIFFNDEIINLSWTAEDDVGIAYFLVYVDSALFANTTSYSVEIPASTLQEGVHEISVVAYDKSGKSSRSSVIITVKSRAFEIVSIEPQNRSTVLSDFLLIVTVRADGYEVINATARSSVGKFLLSKNASMGVVKLSGNVKIGRDGIISVEILISNGNSTSLEKLKLMYKVWFQENEKESQQRSISPWIALVVALMLIIILTTVLMLKRR